MTKNDISYNMTLLPLTGNRVSPDNLKACHSP